MIYKLLVKDPTKAALPWWNTVEWLKDRTEIEFGPGLNILFGKNGSGKSTVIKSIAKVLCCLDGSLGSCLALLGGLQLATTVSTGAQLLFHTFTASGHVHL